MMPRADGKIGKTPEELITFSLGEAQYGLDIRQVEEINRVLEMTKVPQAPTYVNGLVNLRGQIVTIVDLSAKIGLKPAELWETSKIIIVTSSGEYLGLLVDRMERVVGVQEDQVAPVPVNLQGVEGRFLTGVLPTDNGLIGILDLAEVLRVEETGLMTRAEDA